MKAPMVRAFPRFATMMALASLVVSVASGCSLVTSLDGLADTPSLPLDQSPATDAPDVIADSSADAAPDISDPADGPTIDPNSWCGQNGGDASLCADFDDNRLQAFDVVEDAGAVTFDAVTSRSAPNSLATSLLEAAADGARGASLVTWTSPSTTATTADLDFDVRFDRDSNGQIQSHTFARIIVEGKTPAPARWAVELTLGSSARLYLGTRDMATDTSTDATYGSRAQLSMATWTRVHMQVAIFGSGAGKVTLSLDGNPIGSAKVQPPVNGGTLSANIGIIDGLAMPHGAFTTHTDNLTVGIY